jgi:hypothetical protein
MWTDNEMKYVDEDPTILVCALKNDPTRVLVPKSVKRHCDRCAPSGQKWIADGEIDEVICIVCWSRIDNKTVTTQIRPESIAEWNDYQEKLANRESN